MTNGNGLRPDAPQEIRATVHGGQMFLTCANDGQLMILPIASGHVSKAKCPHCDFVYTLKRVVHEPPNPMQLSYEINPPLIVKPQIDAPRHM